MGLDNGIILKTRKELTDKDWLGFAPIIRDRWEKDDGEYSICYWRKCWNIRNKILDYLNGGEENHTGEYIIDTRSQLIAIRDILIDYICDPRKWKEEDADGDTIWEWDEIAPNLVGQIERLTWLSEFIPKIDAPYEVYFYDSY